MSILMCENRLSGAGYSDIGDCVCRVTFDRWHWRQFLAIATLSFRMLGQTNRTVINLAVAQTGVPGWDKWCVACNAALRKRFATKGRMWSPEQSQSIWCFPPRTEIFFRFNEEFILPCWMSLTCPDYRLWSVLVGFLCCCFRPIYQNRRIYSI